MSPLPPAAAAVAVVEAEAGGTGSGGAGGAPVPNVEELAAAADGEEDYRNPFAGTEPQSRRPPFYSYFIADCFSFHLPFSLSNISNQITDRLALVPLYYFLRPSYTPNFFASSLSLIRRNTSYLREGVRTFDGGDQFKEKMV